MTAATDEAKMARPKGRPKTSERQDVTIKLDKGIVGMARMVAAAKGVSLVSYLSEAARPVVEKDFAREMKRLEGSQE